jgi:hypothetical protein
VIEITRNFDQSADRKSADRLVKSTALKRLLFDVWVFGIAYLNIALFEMALTQFCLHVLHTWKEDDQVGGSLPPGLHRLPQGLHVL